MAMLAERKRKQKWTLNPRGKDWSDDSSKFGQKMLEKMGWKSGKGLGPKQNGITEHIKVSYKNDSCGMGFKESENQWTEHDSNFASLLENLNSNSEIVVAIPEVEIGKKSLEQKSQRSRARVHYHKFTRGKDLSRYSEKDLANIFGKKNLNEKRVKKESTSEENSSEAPVDNVAKDPQTFGVQTVTGGSMADYFKKKLPTFGVFGDGYVVGSNGVLKKADETKDNSGNNSEEERPSFGFGFSSKSKSKTFGFDYKTGFSSFVKSENNDETPETNEQKVVKKDNGGTGYCNSFVKSESNQETQAIKNEEETAKKSKKDKKKRKRTVEPVETNESEIKSKKLRKVNTGFELDNPNFNTDDSSETQQNITQEENIYEIKRKEKKSKKDKKKRKREEEDADTKENQSIMQDNESVTQGNQSAMKENRLEIDNPNFSANDINEIHTSITSNGENLYEVKRKEKKAKKKQKKESALEIDNPNFSVDSNINMETADNITSTEENLYEVKRKDKKSKKKNKEPENTSANEIEGDIQIDLRLNVTSAPLTPVLRSVIKEETPGRNETPKLDKTRRKSVRFSEVNEERIIPPNGYDGNLSLEDIQNRNELFDINTRVIENSLEQQSGEDGAEPNSGFVNNAFDIKALDQVSFYKRSYEKELPGKKKKRRKTGQDEAVDDSNSGFVNTAFDIKSVDKTSFYEKNFEKELPKKKKSKKVDNGGMDNVVFNQRANEMEENVVSIAKEIENLQAEVENDINEKKGKQKK